MKPHSQSCENNKLPILKVLIHAFHDRTRVLEIGSGTGQHAVFFAENLSHLFWQTSDQPMYHSGIVAWIESSTARKPGWPLTLNVAKDTWPEDDFDAMFSANTCHIMSWTEVQSMFKGIGRVLPVGGVFALYGPFNRCGEFTSEGNERFHQSLTTRNPLMGIRDDQDIFTLAIACGLVCEDDHEMPANNRLLVFRKQSQE